MDEEDGAMSRLTKEGYNHVEAFALMYYQCETCGYRARVWNSRDGVTSFGIGCRKCDGSMLHIAWGLDERATDHIPQKGQLVFITLPIELRPVIARTRIEGSKGTAFYPRNEQERQELITGIAESFHEGEPFIIEWPY